PFIVVSGTVSEEVAVEVLRGGAHDFVTKQNFARLLPAVAGELREAEIRSEQKRADAALRTSEERFRAIMDTAIDAVIAVESGGAIIYANKAAEGMFGFDSSSLVGVELWQILPERFQAATGAGAASG